jgi:hypothetical protein
MHGFHFNHPFNLGSLWIERSEVHVGYGHQWNDTRMDMEFFFGRIQGVYSRPGQRGLLEDFLRKRELAENE